MIAKGTTEYKEAGRIANKIQQYAEAQRWANNSVFDMYFNYLGNILNAVQKAGGFAAEVAKSVDKTMDCYGFKVAFCSSKQAWILACAIVENEINID